jgi:hypothetical protein
MLPAAALPASRTDVFAQLKATLSRPSGIPLDRVFPTGIAPLDEALGGGMPLGSLVTLEGPCSSGRWGLAAALLARATQRGLGVVIDDGALYPPTLEEAGVRLNRLLVIPAKGALGIARAVDVVLRSRVARVVVLAAPVLRGAVWARLAGLAHRAGAILVVVATRAAAELAGVATVRLGCAPERALVRGTRGVWGVFCGLDVRAEVRKHKLPQRGGCYGTVSLHAQRLCLK